MTVSGALTFKASNWGAPQTVTVLAAVDTDAVDDTAVVGHSPSGGDYGSVTAADVVVTVDDDDEVSTVVVLSVDPDTVGEGDAATTVTVTATLNDGTRAARTFVSVTMGSGTATSGTDFTAVVTGSVRAETTQWLVIPAGAVSVTGRFTLTPTQDAVDEADETVAVTGTTTAPGLSSVTGTQVTLEDDDTRGVTVSAAALDVDEGDSGTYTVVLDSQPTGDVTVTPSRSSGDADVTVSGALTFTAANWDETQTVTVSAAEDADALDDSAVIGHAVSGGDYGSVTAADVAVTVYDDDPRSAAQSLPPTATLALSSTSVGEDGGAATVTATLSRASGAATTVTVSVEPVSPAVAVTGAEVEITDDDSAPTATLSLSGASVGEDGGAATVTATLNHASGAATTVTVSVEPVSPAVAGDYALSANKVLTIAAGATASTGVVTVTGMNNDVDAPDRTVTVKGAASNTVGVTLTLTDDDARGVTVSVADLDIDEGGTGSYTVVLDTQPTGDVTVTPLLSSGDTDMTVSGALIFMAANWSVPQTVTVSAASDAMVEHVVSGGDYGSVEAADVAVTVGDDSSNTYAIPKAWIARYGRTVADQVIEAVEGRMRAGRAPGVEVSLAGERIGGQAEPDSEAERDARGEEEARREAQRIADWLRGETDPEEARRQSRAVLPRDLLTGSSFTLTGEIGGPGAGGGFVTAWGRGAVSHFDGREGDLTLDGEVLTGMLGADWIRERWTAGFIVSHSAGEGGYSGAASGGKVETTLTGVFPWARHALSERLEAWGVAGYGAGELKVTPRKPGTDGNEDENGAAIRADLALRMAAAGLRGVLLDPESGSGFLLIGKTDAMAMQTASGRGTGTDGGRLEPATSFVPPPWRRSAAPWPDAFLV